MPQPSKLASVSRGWEGTWVGGTFRWTGAGTTRGTPPYLYWLWCSSRLPAHLSGCCTHLRALSLPPPVRYADRAADRARTLRYMVPRPSGKQGRGVDWYQMLPTLPHAGHVV